LRPCAQRMTKVKPMSETAETVLSMIEGKSSDETAKILAAEFEKLHLIAIRDSLESSGERKMFSLILQRNRKGRPVESEKLEQYFNVSYEKLMEKVQIREQRKLMIVRDAIPYILDSLPKKDCWALEMLYNLDGNGWIPAEQVCEELGLIDEYIALVELKAWERITRGYELYKDEYLADQEKKKQRLKNLPEIGR